LHVFLSSYIFSLFLFRTFFMFTHMAVWLSLCSSFCSVGKSWNWTSAAFPVLAESSNSSCYWSEADFPRLVASKFLTVHNCFSTSSRYGGSGVFTECYFIVGTSYWADSSYVFKFFIFCVYILTTYMRWTLG
jgi:hypothetical protein